MRLIRVFLKFVLQLLRLAASVEKKTVKITSLDNFKSSRHQVFKNIWERKKLQRKHPWWSGFVGKMKKIILPRIFSWKFSRNFQNIHFDVNLLKPSGWMTITYFFFRNLCVFWLLFHFGRSYSWIDCRWKRKASAVETPDAFIFLSSLK